MLNTWHPLWMKHYFQHCRSYLVILCFSGGTVTVTSDLCAGGPGLPGDFLHLSPGKLKFLYSALRASPRRSVRTDHLRRTSALFLTSVWNLTSQSSSSLFFISFKKHHRILAFMASPLLFLHLPARSCHTVINDITSSSWTLYVIKHQRASPIFWSGLLTVSHCGFKSRGDHTFSL